MKASALLIGAVSVVAFAACASNDPAPRDMTRMEARPAPITSPTAEQIPPRQVVRSEAPHPPTARVATPAGEQMNLAHMIGSKVKNPAGQTIGEVESVLLDRSGRVETVIVSVGGFLGFGAREVALDWDDVKIADGGRLVSVDMTEMQLKQMPEYRASSTTATRTAIPEPRISD